jgi:hypothetical protein
LRFPEQCLGMPKKSGKTATAAAHLLTTTCLFGGRYAEAYCGPHQVYYSREKPDADKVVRGW